MGIEMIWTIDWDAGEEECIAATARHIFGNVGVFHAENLEPVWHMPVDFSSVQASMLYVADVSGDSREEVVVYDANDAKIKIYWNGDSNPDPGPDKWDDPLYRRLKQVWNYYSPGSYTRRDPLILSLKIYLEGAYDALAHSMRTDLNPDLIPLASPFTQDLRVVTAVPEDAVDWVLVQLRATTTGPAVISRSAFIRNDGRVIMEDGSTGLHLFAEKGSYYVVIRHRNHLAVMSSLVVDLNSGSGDFDFSTSGSQFYGTAGGNLLENGVWGMVAGETNDSGIVTNADKDEIISHLNYTGYYSADCNLSGIVTHADKEPVIINLNRSSQTGD